MSNGNRSGGLVLLLLGLAGIVVVAAAMYVFAVRIGTPGPTQSSSEQPIAQPATKGDLFGAIEVGGSGVKATVFRLTAKRAQELLTESESESGFRYNAFEEAREKQYDDLNTKLRDESNVPAAVDYVATLVKRMYDDYAITPNRIYIVLSSGVASLPHVQRIHKGIQARTRVVPGIVSAAEECRLTFDWLVAGVRLHDAVVVDVGSQNSKACYRESTSDGSRARSFELMPWGVKSFESKVAENPLPNETFEQAALRHRSELETLTSLAASGNTGLRTRKRLYLVGGAVWATATLVRPTEILDDWVKLSTPSDFETLRRRAVENRPYEVDLDSASTAEARAALMRDVEKLKTTYTREQLISAMDILLAITKALHVKEEKEATFFARPSAYGWMSRYLLEQLADQNSNLP